MGWVGPMFCLFIFPLFVNTANIFLIALGWYITIFFWQLLSLEIAPQNHVFVEFLPAIVFVIFY